MTTPQATAHTKIVATLGPASHSPGIIRCLIDSGMSVARINASHGDHESHARTIEAVRRAAGEAGRAVGILLDLQGPKIRVGTFDGPLREITTGDSFTLAVGRDAEPGELPTDYALLDRDVAVGHRLLIDDGELMSEVIEVTPGTVTCKALNDAVIAPRKGINLPDSAVSAPAFTDKDRADALFAIDAKVDAVALSFVRQASDVEELREYLASNGSQLPIISKIEKPQALDNLEAIVSASWGVMVARGDLGVELSPEEVPVAQKRIIQTARRKRRPVITATQMLESMTRNPRPTRAEASDVANAVLDGSDAVMLSQETATGRYPVESIQMMMRIIISTERFWAKLRRSPQSRGERYDDTAEAVAVAACNAARDLGARALVAFTQSGMTAILAASRRPTTPIMAFTNRRHVQDLLCFVWGVQPYLLEEVTDTDRLIGDLDATLLEKGLADEGDRLVVLMGAPTRRMGSTNLMLVYRLGQYQDESRP